MLIPVRLRLLSFGMLVLVKLVSFSPSMAAPAGGLDQPSLTIGSKAPDLNIQHWLQDGEGKFKPVSTFEAGSVYVVEFWATWCPPCRESMPQLSRLQKKFADKKVTIISVSDEDLDTVEEFLTTDSGIDDKTYRELTKSYCLTTDPDTSTHVAYMEAANQRGIPASFIVGKDGRIEWIGHPMAMEDPLSQVVADKWDREAFLDKFQVEILMQQAVQTWRQGKPKDAVKMLDQYLEKSPESPSADLLKNVKFQILLRSGGEGVVDEFNQLVKENAKNSQKLDELAWVVFQAFEMGWVDQQGLLTAAVEAAKKGASLSPDDPSVYDTLAHLYARAGKLDNAIRAQTKAIELAKEPELKENLRKFLSELESQAKTKDPAKDDK